MRTAHVQLVHDSTVVSFADARRVVRALRTQVRRDFAPVFGVQADVELVRRGEQDRRAWQIAIVDDEGSAEEQGWHELTAAGLPLGKVLARRALAESGGWTTTASHELLEMLADPTMALAVVVWSDRGSRLYAYEVCDPVQDDRFAYAIEGVAVSNFVYPEWFEPFRRRGEVDFDHRGACSGPLHVLPGGYASVTHTQWQRGWRDLGPSRGKPGASRGSRKLRRRRTTTWRASKP